MTYNQVISEIKSKKFKPIYFLYGDEPFYIDKIAEYAEKNVLEEHEKDFNQTILYGADTTVNDIVACAKKYPMMADYNVVIVKEAHAIRSLIKSEDDSENENVKKKSAKSTAKSALESYLDNPSPTTLLIFCYKKDSIDKRTTLAKKINSNGVLFESKKIYDTKLPDWITDYAKSISLKINPKAAYLLSEYIGSNLSRIANELDKLALNFDKNAEISADHIHQFIGVSKEYNVFELQKALGDKNATKANKIVRYLGEHQKENPLLLTLASLYKYFSNLILISRLPNKSPQNIAATAGINPYFANEYITASKNYPLSKLVKVIEYLKKADLNSKGVQAQNMEQSEILKELVYKIIYT